MEIQKNFDIPFESQFDWRATLFDLVHDFMVDAASDVISKHKEKSQGFEWKDDEVILEFALREGVIDEIIKKLRTDMEEHLDNFYS